MEIGLVSCVKTKLEEPATPQDLYVSDYFQKMQTFTEQNHDRWYIISAKHGLLEPEGKPIDPYEETLNNATATERRQWAEDVVVDLDEEGVLVSDTTLVIHAGKSYYEPLLPLLRDSPVDVEVPTQGLRFGEKKSWYNKRI